MAESAKIPAPAIPKPAQFVVLLLLLGGQLACLPWRHEVSDASTHVFQLENNLPYLRASVDDRPVRMILGTASPATILDGALARSFGLREGGTISLALGNRVRSVVPDTASMRGVADGIIGADALGEVITVDYRSQLISLRPALPPEYVDHFVYAFTGPPAIDLTVDGVLHRAIIDTTLPDSLILPARQWSGSRGNATLAIGDDRFVIDIASGPVQEARVGNRILSRYLVTIDYPNRRSYLWRYRLSPRAGTHGPIGPVGQIRRFRRLGQIGRARPTPSYPSDLSYLPGGPQSPAQKRETMNFGSAFGGLLRQSIVRLQQAPAGPACSSPCNRVISIIRTALSHPPRLCASGRHNINHPGLVGSRQVRATG
jgi:hypothetical protein